MVRVSDVWDRTVEFLGDRLGVLLGIAILGIFVPMSMLNAIGSMWATAGLSTKGALTIAFVALYFVIFWAYFAITAVALDPASASGAWRASARRLPAGIGVYLLLVAAILLLSMPIGVLGSLAGVDMAAMSRGVASPPQSPAMLWATLLYFLVFLAVILAGSARLMPLTGVVVAERRGAGALGRAWRLTRGMTWRLIGVLVLYVVVMQVAVLAAQTVFGSVLRLFARASGGLDFATIVTGIIVAAVQTGFSLLGASFAAKLYEALVRAAGGAAMPVARSVPQP